MGVQPSAESHFRVGGMDVVRKKQKTPLELSLAGLFSDSNRNCTLKPLENSLKCSIFVNQKITFAGSLLFSPGFHHVPRWWYGNRESVPRFVILIWRRLYSTLTTPKKTLGYAFGYVMGVRFRYVIPLTYTAN